VHAAEDDELGTVPRGGRARELQRVAREIGELDHFVALIVVSQDDEAAAERLFRGGDPRVHLVVRETQVLLGNRLPLADALFLDLGEELDVHVVSPDLKVRPTSPARAARPRQDQ
jgi:hypothetical protein